MQREAKIGLGIAAVALAVFAAVRFGSGPAAKTGLDLALANLPPGWAATHGAVSYDALSGNARVDNLVVTQNDMIVFSAASVLASGITGVSPTSPPKRIGQLIIKDAAGIHAKHIGRVEVDGLEVENLRRLFDPSFYPDGKPASDARLPVFSRLTSSDVAVHIDLPPHDAVRGQPNITALDVHVATWDVDGLSLRQFPSPPSPRTLQDWTLVSALGRNIAYGSVVAKDITNDIAGVGRLRIGSEDVAGVQDGKVHSTQIQDLSFVTDKTGEPGASRASLSRFALRDVDLRRWFEQLPAVMTDPQRKTLGAGLTVGGFDMSGGSLDTFNGPLITLASFSGASQYPADGVQTGTATMRGLKIVTTGRTIPQKSALALQRFGMADFNIDLDEAGSYSPASGRLKLGQFDITFHGLGALRLAADVDGLRGSDAPPAEKGMAMLRQLQLYSATLRWDDASLTDRIFHLIAAQSGKPEAALRAQLSVPVASLGFMMPEQPDVGAQVNAFLDGRHRLIITLAPPHPPVSFADVAAAGAAEKAALLGVTVKGD